MSNKILTGALSVLLSTVLIAAPLFFLAPQKAAAQAAAATGAGCFGLGLSGAIGAGGAVISAALTVPVSDAMNLIQNTTSASANQTDCIKNNILMPLARLLARIVLMQITASTVNWITGKNSTGSVMFVQNIPGNLQKVGDTSALAFFAQFGRNSNSPFSAAISSSLRTNYLQQTSMAGFWAANQCTLNRYSPNVNSFLSGNWSQGGISTWFALTTQTQNNPFTLYQASESQLSTVVGSAQSARSQELSWGQGFLSWCSVSDNLAGELSAQQAQSAALESAIAGTSSQQGVNPGDSCENSDGTPGTVETPGSVIHDYTQKAVVSSGLEQLVSAQDLDSALGVVVTALVGQILGSTGLFGASQPSSSGPSAVSQLQGYAASNASASGSAVSMAQTKLSQLASYTGAWNTITASATTASTSAANLANFCTTAADTAATTLLNAGINQSFGGTTAPTQQNLSTVHSTFIDAARAQAVAAQTAITTEIAPIFAQALAAINALSATQTLALKVQSEATAVTTIASSTTAGAAGALVADTQALAAAPPTATDLVNVQQNAQAFGAAQANPAGSLTVSGGSIVDRMNLITANAATLQTTVCNPNSALYAVPQGG